MSTALSPEVYAILEDKAHAAGLSAVPPVQRVRSGDRAVSALAWGIPATAAASPGTADTAAHPSAITLLHGVGLHAHSWDSVVLALGEPALALDLPGHGHSAWNADADYSPARLASDLSRAGVFSARPPQVLIGHSLGGMVAARLAAEHPEAVRALVLIDITPDSRPGEGPTRVSEFLSGPADFGSVEEIVERALAHGIGTDAEALRRGILLNTLVGEDGRRRFAHHLAALIRAGEAPAPSALAPLWPDLEGFAGPLLLIRGDRGAVSEADAEEFRRRLPRARVVAVPGGHNLHGEDPAAVARAVRALLDTLPAAPAPGG